MKKNDLILISKLGVLLLLASISHQAEAAFYNPSTQMEIDCYEQELDESVEYSSLLGTTDAIALYVTDDGYLGRVNEHISASYTFYNYYTQGYGLAIDSAQAEVGDVEEGVVISVTGSGVENTELVAVYVEDGVIGDIYGYLTAIADSHSSATALTVTDDGRIGTIYGSLYAEVACSCGTATWLNLDTTGSDEADTITFGEGARITAVGKDSSGAATIGNAIYSTYNAVTLELEGGCSESLPSEYGAVVIHGNIDLGGDEAITFDSGKYEITSDLWNVSSVVIRQDAQIIATGDPYKDCAESGLGRIALNGSGSTTLIFEVESPVEEAMLIISTGSYFDQFAQVEVRLTDEMYNFYKDDINSGNWGDLEIAIIGASDDDALTSFDGVEFIITNEDGSVTYADGLSHTDCGFVSDFSVVVPEPSSISFAIIGLGLGLLRRPRRKIITR